MRSGQIDEAEKIFISCLRADASDSEAWIGLAILNEGRRRMARAAYCLWRATRIVPNDLSLLFDLGNLYIRGKDYARAIVVFSDLIVRNPNDLQPYIAKSAVERRQNRPKNSRETLLNGIHRNPIAAIPALTRNWQRIVRMQGVQNSHYIVATPPAGAPRIALHRGHFSTEYFWNPALYRTIDCLIHGDDDGWEAALPGHDVIVNTIADPDVESTSLNALARYAATHPQTPIINDPLRVLETSRDGNYRRLRNFPGVVFPTTVRLRRQADGQYDLSDLRLVHGRHDLSFPLILRATGSHTGQTTVRADQWMDAEAYIRGSESDEIYVIDYIEERYRQDLYRKMRVFFIDGEIYPVVHHIDRIWNVHGHNRREVMAAHQWMMDIERDFVTDMDTFLGSAVMATLQSLRDLVRLDFFGIDFTITGRGEILIYEINPAMRHSFDHAIAFPYLRPSLERISGAFRTMVLRRCGEKSAP